MYPAYNVSCHIFILCDNTTLSFDHRPWKTLGIFLLSWWSIVPSCMILELMVHSVSCLQRFPTMWQYDLDLWLLTLKKKNTFLSSCWSIVPSFKILELMIQSVSCLQYILPCFHTMWQYNLDLWPPILKNDRHFPLFMLINCTKL